MNSHTTSKLFQIFCGMMVMLALVAGITVLPVSAASNGIYIADATPHYKHPITGKIEDSGGEGSSVLGQSMTESATYKRALVEVDSAGNTYITVRLQLMDNIQNPEFQVDGTTVSTSLMQEDYTNNTADYRMKVNSENSVIRCNMYVVPMGREVIFYITVANLQAGSEDFITSVKVEQAKQQDSLQTEATANPQSQTQGQVSAASQSQAQGHTSADSQIQNQSYGASQKSALTQSSEITAQQSENTDNVQAETTVPGQSAQAELLVTETAVSQLQDTNSPISSGDSISASALEKTDNSKKDTKSHGLQEFDKEGNNVDGSETKNTKKIDGGNKVVRWLPGIVIVVAATGGCLWYFCIYKKKK